MEAKESGGERKVDITTAGKYNDDQFTKKGKKIRTHDPRSTEKQKKNEKIGRKSEKR